MNKTTQTKQNWKNAGISSFEGFFERSDGMVEIQDNIGTEKGEYYPEVTIISKREAWGILFDSDDFRNEVEY